MADVDSADWNEGEKIPRFGFARDAMILHGGRNELARSQTFFRRLARAIRRHVIAP